MIDSPYKGATAEVAGGTTYATQCGLATSITKWGLKFTGVENASFNPFNDDYRPVSFDVVSDSFSTATITRAIAPSSGSGYGKQIANIEAYAEFLEKDGVQSTVPRTSRKGQTDITGTYDLITFNVDRITSYNVCYTKLLRSKFDKEAISKIVQEEGDAAAIREMFKGHAETLKEEIKTGYDNGYNEYIQLLNGGMPKEEAVGLIQIEKFYNSIENVDLTSEDDYSVAARKDALMLNYRLTTKWSEDKINTYVNKLYDNGEDIEELKEALPNIKEYISSEKQNAKNRAIELEQENRRYIDEQNNKIKSTIKGINEVFKGDQITDLTKTKMEQALFTPVKMKDGSFTNQLWAKRNENLV